MTAEFRLANNAKLTDGLQLPWEIDAIADAGNVVHSQMKPKMSIAPSAQQTNSLLNEYGMTETADDVATGQTDS